MVLSSSTLVVLYVHIICFTVVLFLNMLGTATLGYLASRMTQYDIPAVLLSITCHSALLFY